VASSPTITITKEIEDVLRRSTIRENILYLPGTLDRKLYVAVDSVLQLLGGKWKSGKVKGHVFEDDPGLRIDEALQAGELVDPVKLYQFYPTPKPLARELVRLANIQSGNIVLEPGIGNGALAAEVREDCQLCYCEIQERLRDNFALFAPHPNMHFLCPDFLDYKPGEDAAGAKWPKFHRIVANPPFTKGQAVRHANHMLNCLLPQGRLACIMDAGVLFRTDKATLAFRKRLETECDNVHFDHLPECAFKDSGTLVRTVTLVATLKK